METKRVNEAVSNNPEKFPKGYIWELAAEEIVALRSKISTLKKTGRGQHSKYPPKAFTEKGFIDVFSWFSGGVPTESHDNTQSAAAKKSLRNLIF